MLDFALCFVGVFRQIAKQGKELFVLLAKEEAIGGQRLDGAHGGTFRLGGANDGARREFLAEEDGGFRHDQVGLELFAAKAGVVVEIVKYDR